jgi:DNA replication and repair protein RecF
VRNVSRLELELAPQQNLLVGGNGQGKTTLLEAMYLLGALRSFRGARPGELIQHGHQEGTVQGVVLHQPPSSLVMVLLRRQGRDVRVNDKKPEVAHHFRNFPMVAFHPGDLELIFGGPAVRRRFLDRMLFQAQAGYAQWHRDYHRALRARSELLRQGKEARLVRAYDPLLARLGAQLGAARQRLILELATSAAEILAVLRIAPFTIEHHSRVVPEEEALAEALNRAWPQDQRRRRTTVGPHTDDLTIARSAGRARQVASRGEARAVAVALRLAERDVVGRQTGVMPLLLLDDVWAELDAQRAALVLGMVAEQPGQVVATGTGRMDEKSLIGWRRFTIAGGTLAD